MKNPIRLIATDLDGTIIGSVDEFPLYTTFREALQRYRREGGTRWAVITGRSMRSFKAFFSPMKAMGLEPDFVIVHHALIYTRGRTHFRPHWFWNLRSLLLVLLDRSSARRRIHEWHRRMAHTAVGVRTIRRRKDRLWLRFDTQEAANYAAAELHRLAAPFGHFRVFQFPREVDVRAVPFTKGMALRQLCRNIGVKPDETLAIGNGHNDISALDGGAARFVGCPSNSEPEVMAAVHAAGGHIATERSLRGVLEILDAVAEDRVRSELPTWWENPSEQENPARRHEHHARNRRKKIRTLVLVVAIAATVLTVFAEFHMLGPLSRPLAAPYHKVMQWIEKLATRALEAWFSR